MMFERVVNLSDPATKELVLDDLRARTGLVRIKIGKARSARADRLLKFYFPAIVKPFADRLRAMGIAITERQVHGLLCLKFLRTPVVNRATGEVLGQMFSATEDLNDEELQGFVNKAEAWVTGVMEQMRAERVSAGAA